MGKLFKTVEDISYVKYNNKEEALGTGSFSQVKLIYHRNNPLKYYAMKELRKTTKIEADYINREIELHCTLDHPNIIKFEDYLDCIDRVYIFLEYAKNGDLFKFVKNKKIKKSQLVKFFYQTCMAIKYIHDRDIMHRDLKPENILLDSNLDVKICDFGWSAKYSDNIVRATLCGTFEYMAPEIFFKNKQTKKADIWSLGILLYELFHNHAPFQGTRMDLVINQIMKNRISFKKKLNDNIRDLILKMIVIDPRKRIELNNILSNPLFEELKQERVLKRNLSSNLNNERYLSKNIKSFLHMTNEFTNNTSHIILQTQTQNQTPQLSQNLNSHLYFKGQQPQSNIYQNHFQNNTQNLNKKIISTSFIKINPDNSFKDIYSKLKDKKKPKKIGSSFFLSNNQHNKKVTFVSTKNLAFINKNEEETLDTKICSIQKDKDKQIKENLLISNKDDKCSRILFKKDNDIKKNKKKNTNLNPLKVYVDFKNILNRKK